MYVCMSRSLNLGKTLQQHLCKCVITNNVWTFRKRSISCTKQINSKEKDTENVEHKDEDNLPSGFLTKYKVFRDDDAPIIFDVNEEKKRIELEELNIEDEDEDPYAGINKEHGVHGVFDIEDLVELLKRDNAKKIFVASVPKEYSYVDYIVVVSGKSAKHMQAIATFVRKMYKIKKHKNEVIPKIEGDGSKDWLALDLGNIALHIFSNEARVKYDLETLWSVGSKYDDLSNQKFNEFDILNKYTVFLKQLQPAE